MKRKLSLVLISIGIFFLIILTSCSKVPTEEELYACNEDNDCVIVSENCCGCPRTIINKDYTEYWNNKFDCQEKGTFGCPLIDCIDTKPVCVEGKCQQESKYIDPLIKLKQLENKVINHEIKNIKPGILKFKVSIVQRQAYNSNPIFGKEIDDNFLYHLEIQELQPNQSISIPIEITSETTTGTDLFKLTILDVTNSEEGVVYESKTFFITVS